MAMKKFLVPGAAVMAAVFLAGCQWCSEPLAQNPSCIKLDHEFVTSNHPATTSMVTPNIAISREVFRPVFRAGAGRLTVVGSGNDREDATYDAIAKFLSKANCDYIVAVSTISVKTVHPSPWWYLWGRNNRNYSVTLSGIPVYLEKLSTETLAADKVEAYDRVSGLYLPGRGFGSDPAKAVRLAPPMPNPLPENLPVPTLAVTESGSDSKGAESSSSSLLPVKLPIPGL